MANQENQLWARKMLDQVIAKMEYVRERSAKKIPYTAVNGVHDDWSDEEHIGWWTNGFWGGMMWQLYALTKDEAYKTIAQENEKKLDVLFLDYQKLDHDNGFKWLPTAVIDYRLTGNKQSRNRGILAADNLAGRFHVKGNFIRAWNDVEEGDEDRRGWAIIDCMMNLPLLYWATETTKDPRYLHIAMLHADMAMEHFVREDGSVHHIVEFDVDTGEKKRAYGGQGYKEGSSWTRGQAWGLYGFVLSYLHTQKQQYLDTAKRIARYFIQQMPESGKIPVDFCQPKEITWEDSTAAAIAASGMLELAKQLPAEEAQVYEEAAVKLLTYLCEHSVSWDCQQDPLLTKCTAAYHDKEHEFPIIYGDYFFLEALAKLVDEALFIW